jgi:hypothetical protein
MLTSIGTYSSTLEAQMLLLLQVMHSSMRPLPACNSAGSKCPAARQRPPQPRSAAVAVTHAAARKDVGTAGTSSQQQQQNQQHLGPPDVAPHVLLSLDPVWLHSSSTLQQQQVNETDSSNSVADEQQHLLRQQQQQLLVPKTSARLTGMSLPGFLPRLGPYWGAADHQILLVQQQVSLRWSHTPQQRCLLD